MRAKIFRRSAGSLVPLLLAGALVAGCDRHEESATRTNATPATAETPRQGGTLVLQSTAEPPGVNEYLAPANALTDDFIRTLFLRLVEEQPDFEQHPPTFAPRLARSYEFSPDHKTLTFHLRDDVVWSDGVPVTADDVRFTWQAQVHPDVAWDSVSMKANIADVEVVDPKTVRFHFSRAYAKQLIDVNEGAVLPKHVWEKLPFAEWRKNREWFKEHLVTDGPFAVESWQPQQQVVLRRNPRFYKQDRPLLDRLVFRVIPDASTAMAELASGQIDFISQISPGDASQVKGNPRLQFLAYWFSRLIVGVAWNTSREMFADPEVRQALTLGIDRATIVDTLWGEYGKVADSPLSSRVWGHDRSLQPWPYDPEGAKRILAAKGWKDTDGDGFLDRHGKRFSFEILSNAGNQQRNDAAVMIQEQLRRIGIEAKPRVLEFNSMMQQADSGDFDANVVGMAVETSLDLTSYFHSRAVPPEGINFMRYSNPEVDQLIDRSKSVLELAQAKPFLYRIQKILRRDQPVTFLWESQRVSAANRRVQNVRPNVISSLFNLEDWWVRP